MNSVKISSLVLMGAFTVGITSGSAVSAVAGTEVVSGKKDESKEGDLDNEKAFLGDDVISVGNGDAETNAGDDASEESKKTVKDNGDDEANLGSENEEKNDKAFPENDEKFEENSDKIDVGKDPNKSNEADNNKLSSENNGKIKSVDNVKMPGNTNTEKVVGAAGVLLALIGLGTNYCLQCSAEELKQSKKSEKGSQKQKDDEKEAKEDNGDKNKINPDPDADDSMEEKENKSTFIPWYIAGLIIVAAIIIFLFYKLIKCCYCCCVFCCDCISCLEQLSKKKL